MKEALRIAASTAIALSACTEADVIVNPPDIPGGGSPPALITVTRSIPEIDRVVLSGTGSIVIEQGNRTELRIRTYPAVLDHLATTVANGELDIGWSGSFTLDHELVLECYLTVRSLAELRIAGLWKTELPGLHGSPLLVVIDGIAEVTLDDLDIPRLELTSTGPGDVTASGSATALALTLAGQGSFKGRELVSDEADVAIHGTGSATIGVHNRLSATITGSGNVFYYGDASVSRMGGGAGRVLKLGG